MEDLASQMPNANRTWTEEDKMLLIHKTFITELLILKCAAKLDALNPGEYTALIEKMSSSICTTLDFFIGMESEHKRSTDKILTLKCLLTDDYAYLRKRFEKRYFSLFKKVTDIQNVTRWLMIWSNAAVAAGQSTYASSYLHHAVRVYRDEYHIRGEAMEVLQQVSSQYRETGDSW